MTGSQYKNVAQWTLANTPGVEAMDSASAARMIFNNLGVAFPNGSCEEILLTLMSEDYMGGRPAPTARRRNTPTRAWRRWGWIPTMWSSSSRMKARTA